MSEEIKIEEKCLCHSKGFRKFMTIAGGSFVGVFLAMSLFAALHKPPVFIPYGGCPCGCHQMARPMYGHHFDKDFRGDRGHFHKKFLRDMEGKPLPAKGEKPDIRYAD